MTPASRNPFRADRLDALAFVPHAPGIAAEEVIDRFRRHGWRGAIVGPHGTGKSTLLRTLADAAEAGGSVMWRPFFNCDSPRGEHCLAPPPDATVWAIDGWCHLSPPRRWRLRCLARSRGAGVLGTAHLCGWGLPVLHRTRATPALLTQLAESLAPGTSIDAAALLRTTRGNARDAFFALYDREAGRVTPTPAADGASARPPRRPAPRRWWARAPAGG